MLVHFHVIFVQLFMAKRLTPAAAHSGLTSASPRLVPTPAHSCSICSPHLVRMHSILFCRLRLLHLRVSFNRNYHFPQWNIKFLAAMGRLHIGGNKYILIKVVRCKWGAVRIQNWTCKRTGTNALRVAQNVRTVRDGLRTVPKILVLQG